MEIINENIKKNNKWVIGTEYTKEYFRNYHKNSPMILCDDCNIQYKQCEKAKHNKTAMHEKKIGVYNRVRKQTIKKDKKERKETLLKLKEEIINLKKEFDILKNKNI
jgi:hypothetical protein